MMDDGAPEMMRWRDAVLAARILALDAALIGGATIRSPAGPVRDAWLALLTASLSDAAKLRRIPLNVADGRLIGGLDLAATLATGRPVAERGLLAQCDGGIALMPSAERASLSTITAIASALDQGEVRLARDGIARVDTTRFGVIAFDEARDDDEAMSPMLTDRLAITIDLNGLPLDCTQELGGATLETTSDIAAASARMAQIACSDDDIEAMCATAIALGITSLRAPLHGLRVARASAALAGRMRLTPEDLEVAVRLVLVPRATQIPVQAEAPPAADPPPPDAENANNDEQSQPSDAELEDVLLAAARAALPPGLLETLRRGLTRTRAPGAAGRVGRERKAKAQRGRTAGTRRGDPRAGGRLDILETVRAAAPWQKVRRVQRGAHATCRDAMADDAPGADTGNRARLLIRRDDFRLRHYKHHAETATIFVVDASGSAALHRLAEAKGAVELLLADCYVRRDQVALIAFRGKTAEVLLPPTRSLSRAKRTLAALPGGGGTPLAAAAEQARALASAEQRKGRTPTVVFLTDGRANIDRRGVAGRAAALADAKVSANAMRVDGLAAIVIDTSAHPSDPSEEFARAMGATYLPLPHADATTLSRAIRSVAG